MAVNRKIGRLEKWKERPLILPTIHSSIQVYENTDLKPLHDWPKTET